MPLKTSSPSPGVRITSRNTLKPSASPRLNSCNLLSISSLDDCARSFCTSRMQTPRNPSPPLLPGSAWQSSIIRPAKKCDLPEPRPPHAPLSRASSNSGRKTLAVGICRIDNDALDLVGHATLDSLVLLVGQPKVA